VVICEATKALSNCVSELDQGARPWLARGNREGTLATESADTAPRPISYEVLRSYFDVEGGLLFY